MAKIAKQTGATIASGAVSLDEQEWIGDRRILGDLVVTGTITEGTTLASDKYAETATVSTYSATSAGNTTPTGIKGAIGQFTAGGGGGGSGRRGAAGGIRTGGAGGGSGGVLEIYIPATLIGATYDITIGAKGTGGAVPAGDGTDGNAGTAGGDTIFVSGTTTFRATGGGAGAGGTATGASASVGGSPGGSPGAAAPGTGLIGSAPLTPGAYGPSSGGGGCGGGITGANADCDGGPGGTATVTNQAGGTGGVVDGAVPTAPAALWAGAPGGGAGGGAANADGAGQAGADGVAKGAGGGGGGASVNGSAAGKGGDGVAGYARILWVY